jgi:hypothetical protein
MATTNKGHIERLPSGSCRVRVYAGTGLITGKEIYRKETCPDDTTATVALGKFLEQAEGHRTLERSVLFGTVLDTYLEVTPLAVRTMVVHSALSGGLSVLCLAT